LLYGVHNLSVKSTEKKQVLDITDKLGEFLPNENGLCHLFAKHTTTALTTANLDPGTDLDLLDAFEAMMPKLNYRHPHNPGHVGSHILSSMVGTSLIIPVEDGQLVLGNWQRVVLIDFDGPKDRQIILTFIKTE